MLTPQDLDALKAEFGTLPAVVATLENIEAARDLLKLRQKAMSPRYRIGELKRQKNGYSAAILDDHHPSGVAGVEVYFTKTVEEARGLVDAANAKRVPLGYVLPKKGGK